ncbi:MAG: HU family DNA-binding protein [Deltaproteobacteria bacterium]|jgi:nucleoid DNA-binding protein|nr:HU family DNA-binding protein [Deltaproteobacteria bacterium]
MTGKSSTLTRAELVQLLRERLSLSSKDANKIIDSALETISEVLAAGGAVSLMSLGRFEVKATPARPGRNPKTGAYAMVPRRLRPTFAVSRSLHDRMLELGPERSFAAPLAGEDPEGGEEG